MNANRDIYDRQDHVGLILFHTETGNYRYFKLFETPIYVSRLRDFNKLKSRLQEFEGTDFIMRLDTKWEPHLVTNVRFALHHLNFSLRREGSVLLQGL